MIPQGSFYLLFTLISSALVEAWDSMLVEEIERSPLTRQAARDEPLSSSDGHSFLSRT